MNCTFKFILSITIGMSSLCPYTSIAQLDKKDKQIVVIDPGHGGDDSGAIGIDGIIEKDVVLKIALELIELNNINKQSELDFYLTRYSDTLISLKDRVLLGKALETNLFISLHCNKSLNANAKGVEVYAFSKKRKFSDKSVFIGYHIEKGLKSEIGLKSRGVKFANFEVLRESEEYFPAILIEFGFLSNVDESEYLKNPENLKSLAHITYQTINKFLKK